MSVEIIRKSDIIRKRDPTLRKSITMATFEKIKKFLKDQTEPVYRSQLKNQGVDLKSLDIALNMLPIKCHEDGRISLK